MSVTLQQDTKFEIFDLNVMFLKKNEYQSRHIKL